MNLPTGRLFALVSAAILAGLVVTHRLHAQASFTFVGGSLDGLNYIWGVSNDGTLVGEGLTPDGISLGFRWTKTDGLTFLQPLPGDVYTAANAISADGTIIVGISFSTTSAKAVYWNLAGTPIDPGIPSSSQFLGVSDNGKVMVGPGGSGSVRWTQATGAVDLGSLPGPTATVAFDASNNGVVVGVSALKAFRWTKAGGIKSLGLLPGANYAIASAVSENGAMVTGFSGTDFDGHVQPFLWTEKTGMIGLGLLPDKTWAAANAITGDGSMIIGVTSPREDYLGGGFIWSSTQGMRSFTDVLINDYGLGAEIEGLTEIVPQAISAKGRYIAGMSTYGGWLFDRGAIH